MTALSTPNCRPAACTVVAAAVALALTSAGLAQTRPTTKPAAPPAATTAPASHPTSAPAGDLPKGEDLVNAGLEAMGGKKAFDDLESMSVQGNASMMGQELTLDIKVGKGDRFVMSFANPMMGNTTLGSDGKIGWVMTAMAPPQVVDGPQVEQLRSQAQQINMYHMVFNMKDEFSAFETVEKTMLGDKDVYKVKATPKDAPQSLQVFLFFGTENKLPLGMNASQTDGMMEQTINFEEWKKFDKFNLFTKVNMHQNTGDQTINYEKVEFNKVDPSAFEPPPEVKEAMKPKEPAGSQPASKPATSQPSGR